MRIVPCEAQRHGFVNVKRVYAGTSGALEYCLDGYSAADGWASHVVLRHRETQAVIQLAADGTGEDYSAAFAAGESSSWKAGEYRAYVYASRQGEKKVVAEYDLQIHPDPEGDVSKTSDEVELEAVQRAIAGVLAGEGVQNYSFETAAGRRSADRMSLSELRAHQQHLERRVRSARAKAEGRPDPHGFRQVHARFNR